MDPDDNKSYSWEELRCSKGGGEILGGIFWRGWSCQPNSRGLCIHYQDFWSTVGWVYPQLEGVVILEEFCWFILLDGLIFWICQRQYWEVFWTQKYLTCTPLATQNGQKIVLNWFIMTLGVKSTIKRIVSPLELLMKWMNPYSKTNVFFLVLDHSKNRSLKDLQGWRLACLTWN